MYDRVYAPPASPQGDLEQRGSRWPFLTFAGVCLALLALALLRYGLPLDGATVLALGVGLAFVAFVGALPRGRGRWFVAVIPLVFHLHLHFPLTSDHLQDVHGGRAGVLLAPMLRFGYDGPNTALLERQLGPLPPEWRHRCVRSMLLGSWRDGNERVNSRSLIYREDYAQILDLLPDTEARRQVSACLTDSDNLARVHQGLLLTCLKVHGYPEGYDAQTWWATHRWAFVPARDPRAALHVFEWTRVAERWDHPEICAQVRAAEYQERGGWGGDRELASAYWDEQGRLERGEAPPAAGKVAWWAGR